MAKGSGMSMVKKLLMVAAIVGLIYLLLNSDTAKYSMEERMYASAGDASSPSESPSDELAPDSSTGFGCDMKVGTGLASSLLPREVAAKEDFGQFAPDEILSGQNFLDPRMQIGFPETIGGTLRNGNQQLRADPPNTKDVYVWNNSTIVPDMMQRSLCT